MSLKNRILIVFLLLVSFNVLIWVLSTAISYRYPYLLGLVAIAYGLGLRHGVDADHIAAIDNTIRKLIKEGQKPVGVGLFFSLGHSTVVVILSILVALSSSVVYNLPSIKQYGQVIGTLVSSFFLLLIGLINFGILVNLLRQRNLSDSPNLGLLTRLFKPLLKIVDSSWKMYPVGFLFGLGFDTASEVSLLGISASVGTSHLPLKLILLLPLSFTAGMTLIDSLDGILMLGAYGWAQVDENKRFYYNLTLTALSTAVALLIGGAELLQVIKLS